MEDLTEGERQRREVNSYNVFYSSVTDRADPCLSEHGVRVPLLFPRIEDHRNGVTAEPDFVLYDGETVVLVEIKSGNNLDQRHVEQLRRNDAIDIRTAEETLHSAQVRERTEHSGDAFAVETAIVYQDLDETYIQEASDASEQFRSTLRELTEYGVVMTQGRGETLRPVAGTFEADGVVQRLLSDGITLPTNPPDQILLTENMECEILAIAVADIWGEAALDSDDGKTVSRNEVRDYFAPRHNVSLDDLSLVFEFLTEYGACECVDRDEHRYEFRHEHVRRVLGVESVLMEQTVEEYLHGSEQSTLFDDYS